MSKRRFNVSRESKQAFTSYRAPPRARCTETSYQRTAASTAYPQSSPSCTPRPKTQTHPPNTPPRDSLSQCAPARYPTPAPGAHPRRPTSAQTHPESTNATCIVLFRQSPRLRSIAHSVRSSNRLTHSVGRSKETSQRALMRTSAAGAVVGSTAGPTPARDVDEVVIPRPVVVVVLRTAVVATRRSIFQSGATMTIESIERQAPKIPQMSEHHY